MPLSTFVLELVVIFHTQAFLPEIRVICEVQQAKSWKSHNMQAPKYGIMGTQKFSQYKNCTLNLLQNLESPTEYLSKA